MNEQEQSRPKRARRYVVGRVDEFPEDNRLIVEANGREIGIFKVDGQFFALLNRCPHLGGPLCKGQVVKDIVSSGPGVVRLEESRTYVTCPYHNWEFDVRTGDSYIDPKNMSARAFNVDVQDGSELAEQIESGTTGRIKGPYQAETIDVHVEDDYIVLWTKPILRKEKAS